MEYDLGLINVAVIAFTGRMVRYLGTPRSSIKTLLKLLLVRYASEEFYEQLQH